MFLLLLLLLLLLLAAGCRPFSTRLKSLPSELSSWLPPRPARPRIRPPNSRRLKTASVCRSPSPSPSPSASPPLPSRWPAPACAPPARPGPLPRCWQLLVLAAVGSNWQLLAVGCAASKSAASNHLKHDATMAPPPRPGIIVEPAIQQRGPSPSQRWQL